MSGKFLRVYLVFDKVLILLWQKCFAIGQVFNVVYIHILKNNLAIWSYWPPGRVGVGIQKGGSEVVLT